MENYMEFVDTHAHLYTEEFENDRNDIILRAKNEGVKRVILPAIDSKSHEYMIKMAEENEGFAFPLMGLHPTSVDNNYKSELKIAENFLSQGSFFHGIGEIGIDLYWDKTYYKEQLDAFKIQVEWAKEMNWPIVIHTRDSFDEVYKALYPLMTDDLTGIFHCFGGTEEQAKLIIEMGFKLGIGGVLTFKNSKLSDVLQKIDLNHIVLETDSPYLAPVPYRGKRNESSYLKLIATKLSEVYNVSVNELAKITTENAIRVFNL
ncbi:MAG: TatD family hydrolase [Salinivirgaceae bacterium]|nr:TatD family hydrolase [Salinivirgaceae bacterium]